MAPAARNGSSGSVGERRWPPRGSITTTETMTLPPRLDRHRSFPGEEQQHPLQQQQQPPPLAVTVAPSQLPHKPLLLGQESRAAARDRGMPHICGKWLPSRDKILCPDAVRLPHERLPVYSKGTKSLAGLRPTFATQLDEQLRYCDRLRLEQTLRARRKPLPASAPSGTSSPPSPYLPRAMRGEMRALRAGPRRKWHLRGNSSLPAEHEHWHLHYHHGSMEGGPSTGNGEPNVSAEGPPVALAVTRQSLAASSCITEGACTLSSQSEFIRVLFDQDGSKPQYAPGATETGLLADLARARALRCRTVFRDLQSGGEIRPDMLSKALSLIGFMRPRAPLILAAFKRSTHSSMLTEPEFIEFLTAYEQEEDNACVRAFEEKSCTSDDGSVDIPRMHAALANFGVCPLPEALREVVQEVICAGGSSRASSSSSSVSDDGCVFAASSLPGVVQLLRILAMFSRSEAESLVLLFDECDHVGCGLGTDELKRVFAWLGHSLDDTLMGEVLEGAGLSPTSLLTKYELLLFARALRSQELDHIFGVLRVPRQRMSEKIVGLREMKSILCLFGYLPDLDAVHEVAKDLGFCEASEMVTPETMWRFLELYRARDGLTRARCATIKAEFSRCSGSQGRVPNGDAGLALRAVGFRVPFNMLQKLLSGMGALDAAGLTLVDFRSLIRKLSEMQLQRMRLAFEDSIRRCDGACSPQERFKDFIANLTGSGVLQQQSDACCELDGGDDIDFNVFAAAACRLAVRDQLAVEVNGGFTDQEMQDIREMFHTYDTDNDGKLEHTELQNVVERLLPVFVPHASAQPCLLQVVSRCDLHRAGSIDFMTFLQLLRQIWRQHVREVVAQEKRATQSTAFSQKEVCAYRELYLRASNFDRQQPSLPMLRDVLETVVTFDGYYLQKLEEAWAEAAHRRPSISFPEFLCLMRCFEDSGQTSISAYASW